MPKPILFIDFFKTINDQAYWRSMPIEEMKKIQKLIFGSDLTLVDDWMRGKYTAEQVNEFVSKELGIEYERLWNVFVDDCNSIRVENSILESINRLRGKYTVVLLTDNMDSFTRFTCPMLKLDRYFDAISNSYEAGLLKKDNGGVWFLKQVSLHGARIQDCILLDDSRNNNEIFRNLGGTPQLVTADCPVSYHFSKLL